MSIIFIIIKFIALFVAVIIIHTISVGLIGAIVADIYSSQIVGGDRDKRLLIAERYARPIGTYIAILSGLKLIDLFNLNNKFYQILIIVFIIYCIWSYADRSYHSMARSLLGLIFELIILSYFMVTFLF